MKVYASAQNVTFGRNLDTSEMKRYKEVLTKGKNLTGQTGKSIYIMPECCLPQTDSFNSGVGTLSSDISQQYLEYMRDYVGFNMVEDLPSGQVKPFRSGFYCAYHSSALALGNQHINPELLLTKEFGKLLTKKDLKDIANSNTNVNKSKIVNFKNVIDSESTTNKVLKRAFERFNHLKNSHPLKRKFGIFIEENSDWLNFKREGEDNQEFFKFKQFLAEEHLRIGKEKLNAKGIKLCGDCLINFSEDEQKAFPNAFLKDHFVGLPEWSAPALNYDEITDESSDAAKLLKRKIQLMARRYDAIRFDVGWAYVTPVITPKGCREIKQENKKYMGDSVLKLIEKWVKEVKGQDFDLNNLMYEFDADPAVFSMFGNDGKLIPPLKNRVKILGSTYMKKFDNDTWGYNEAYQINRGWSPDEYVLGVGNHDPQPLRQIAKNMPDEYLKPDGSIGKFYHKANSIGALAHVLKLPAEILENPVEFAKAKWAEPMMSKNSQMFYMDVFGREERFDKQSLNSRITPEQNYAYKVSTNYKTDFMAGLREGFGFNPMSALKRVFIAKGYDKTHPDLFKEIEKFESILLEAEPENISKYCHSKYIKVTLGLLLGLGAAVGTAWAFINSKKKIISNEHSTSLNMMNDFLNK